MNDVWKKFLVRMRDVRNFFIIFNKIIYYVLIFLKMFVDNKTMFKFSFCVLFIQKMLISKFSKK